MPTEIDVELLCQKFIYDPETGALTHRKNGKPASITIDSGGYRCAGITISKGVAKVVRAHRVAFALMEGRGPNGDIDHINGNRSDNRWSNLRECSRSENLHNQVKTRKKSNLPANIVMQASGSFLVQVWHQGRFVTQKTFKALDEAPAHRNMVFDQYGFSPRHGGRDKEVA